MRRLEQSPEDKSRECSHTWRERWRKETGIARRGDGNLSRVRPLHFFSSRNLVKIVTPLLISESYFCSVLCLDNPTNGLDSATALDFIHMMREFTNQHGCSTAMSVYQGSDSMVSLFDKVLVINGGRQIFYGKATEAKSYFEGLGFVCPERTTITDFLNSMTSDPELRHTREGWRGRVPTTARHFEETYKKSDYYKEVVRDVAQPRSQDVGPQRRVYCLPLHRQILECSVRQFRVLAGDRNTWMTEAITIIVQSLVLGTLFRDQPRTTRALFMLGSSLFNVVLVPALQSMAEFSNSFAERPLVIRQKRFRFYRPSAYAMGLVLTDAVWKIVAIAYNIPQYFLTGFQRSADRFFTWFCIVYVLHMALSMVFRAIAVSSPSIGRAVLPVGIMFNIFVLYAGLYVPGPQMQIWLFWVKYCNVRPGPIPTKIEALRVLADSLRNLATVLRI